jgi:hypothetical protein
MDQKLWMFEVSRRSLGKWACAGDNEEELTTCAKFWGQEVGGRGQGEYKKQRSVQERSATAGRWPPTAPRLAVVDCWSPLAGRPLDGRRPAVARRSTAAHSGWRPVVARWSQVAAWTVGRRVFFLVFFGFFFLKVF